MKQTNPYSYLALGDSYTIGESVPIYESFPYQTVELLRKKGIKFHAPEIIAKTGWTTDELMKGIDNSFVQPPYDIVTLLIGVNNQYRDYTVASYIPGFTSLLERAIAFAGNKKEHVFVLSIPDWGVTPFAEGRDRNEIGKMIDAFNQASLTITNNTGCHYIDITPGSRKAASDKSLVAADGLHPSGKMYTEWANALAEQINTVFQ
jgi:lysophospholipase L1-like esterase